VLTSVCCLLPPQAEIKAWQKQQAKQRYRDAAQRQQAKQQQQQQPSERGKVEKFQIEQEQPVCRFWQLGRCAQGAACPYRHEGQPLTKSVACKYFRVGKCSKGDACPYSHDLSTEICRNMLLTGAGWWGLHRQLGGMCVRACWCVCACVRLLVAAGMLRLLCWSA
jgi:hypothetical protein